MRGCLASGIRLQSIGAHKITVFGTDDEPGDADHSSGDHKRNRWLVSKCGLAADQGGLDGNEELKALPHARELAVQVRHLHFVIFHVKSSFVGGCSFVVGHSELDFQEIVRRMCSFIERDMHLTSAEYIIMARMRGSRG